MRSRDDDYVEVECVVERVTEAAVMTEDEIWLPRSQIETGDEVQVGDGPLMVARWLAEAEGLL